MNNRFTICGFILTALAAVFVFGCAEQNPDKCKTLLDEKSYKIIDGKWQDDFGSKNNYKISDIEPSAGDIQIAKTIPASGILTLPQAVAIATANSRIYQIQKEEMYLRAMDLILSRHAFAPHLAGIVSEQYLEENGFEQLTTTAGFGFEQLLAGGTRISAAIAAGWLDIITGNAQGGLATILIATVSQPLLARSEYKIALENLTQAERNVLYQLRIFNRFRRTFVVEVVTKYYVTLQLSDTMKNARNNYEVLCNVYEKAEKLSDAGRIARFEFDQIEQDKLNAKDTWIQDARDYKQSLDELKFQLAISPDAMLILDVNELDAIASAAEANELNFSESQALEAALSCRLDLANSADAVIDGRRKVTVAAEQLGMELTLTASTDFSTERKTGFDALSTLERGGVQIGADLDFGLDRTAEQDAYRRALITLNQSRRNYAELADLIILEIRRSYRDLQSAAEQRKVQLQQLALARKRFDNTFLLLQYGRASSRRVLDAQSDLFDAQNAKTKAVVNYTIAVLNFYCDSGLLQVKPDGMWQSSASSVEPKSL
ncbi:MAG: TolC family protein [Planctomycetes bacterium]|nr:TolC family protein [Planctomycetota bacterium]